MPRKPTIGINERPPEPTAGARVNVNAAGEDPSNLYGQLEDPSVASFIGIGNRGRSRFQSPASSLSGSDEEDRYGWQREDRVRGVRSDDQGEHEAEHKESGR